MALLSLLFLSGIKGSLKTVMLSIVMPTVKNVQNIWICDEKSRYREVTVSWFCFHKFEINLLVFSSCTKG